MAEAAAGEQRRQRKLGDVLLTCFCASVCRKEQLQLAPTDKNDIIEEGRRSRRRPSTAAVASDENKPLRKIADAFKELGNVVSCDNPDVEIAAFARACSFVAPLFGGVGFHFKFIEMDYVTKVNDLAEASKSVRTLQSMVDRDMQTNTVRKQGSHSRNLLKIKRGLDFLRVLFEQILLAEGNSIRDAVSEAYGQIFNSYHGWALRKAVSARLHYIPTKEQLYSRFNEDEPSARVLMQAYIMASPPLLQYIEKIFLSRNLGIDW